MPPQGAVDVVTASCHSSAEVDGAWLAARHHELTHYWPPPPLGARLFSPLLCANISPFLRALFSVCLIQAARWVNARTPLAGRASPSGRSQWGTDSDWLNMPLFLANWLSTRGAFTPSVLFPSLPLQILQERGSRMWRGLGVTSARCYDANISSLWKNVWHNGDWKGGLCIYFVDFPPPPPPQFWF